MDDTKELAMDKCAVLARTQLATSKSPSSSNSMVLSFWLAKLELSWSSTLECATLECPRLEVPSILDFLVE